MISKYLFLFSLTFVLILSPKVCIGAQEDLPPVQDPDMLLLEAQREMLETGYEPEETLPMPESDKDGYWWVKQDYSKKSEYIEGIKALLQEQGITILKLGADKIIEELDRIYNPKDNPLDIKMDKSIERMFYEITKEMMIKGLK